MMPVQRACVAESRVRNKSSNGPRRVQSNALRRRVFCNVTTNFYLEHDRPDETITVAISVYNINGMLMWQTQKTGIADMFKSFPITWNLTTSSGARIPGGVYLYRATISTDDTHYSTKSQKLLVLPQ